MRPKRSKHCESIGGDMSREIYDYNRCIGPNRKESLQSAILVLANRVFYHGKDVKIAINTLSHSINRLALEVTKNRYERAQSLLQTKSVRKKAKK